MGTVFLGKHTLLGRHAAIKVLLPELSSKRDSVDRFFNEARATTTISDPGIVQVFDFGFTTDNIAYIVMELLEGEQLNVRLQRLGALSPADALRITRQAAGSLAVAHAAGIVHRDLKPENMYMIRDPEAPGGERPKILDFGIAKLGDEVPDRAVTRTGAVMGTPVYMSPEQCNGAARVDHRADIYALGCVLFHLLTGRPPFDMQGLGAIISAHLREQPPLPSSLMSNLPGGLDDVVMRCLAKSPDDRFQTMFELQQACDAILGLITLGGAATPSRSMPIAARSAVLVNQATRTTLGDSVGEPLVVPRRRRLGLWIVIAALAGGTGSTIAVLSSRPGAHRAVSGSSSPAATAIPDSPGLTLQPDAAASIEVSGGGSGAAVPDAAVEAAPAAADAQPAAPAVPPEPAAITRPPAVTRQPPATKPTPKAKPPKPKSEDVYDDRN